MNTSRLAPAIFFTFAISILAPATAAAYGVATFGDSLNGNLVRWANPNIPYHLDSAGTNGLTAAESQQCMDESFADWQAINCTTLRFTKSSSTTNKNVLPMSTGYPLLENGLVELVWINDNSWNFSQGTLGVTMVNGSLSSSGVITEGDIAFNGRDYKWNLDGNVGSWRNDMDCKSVVIHEIGHLFGLQHVLGSYSYDDPPTMLPMVDPYGRAATLSPDDMMGACLLYPVDTYFKCKNNSECPVVIGHNGTEEVEVGQIYCQSGYCQGGGGMAPGSVPLGGTCRISTDCVSGTSCTTLSTGFLICTRGCIVASDDCPDGYHCDTSSDDGSAVCVSGGRKKAIGETCSSSYDCLSAYCHAALDGKGMTCRQKCPKASPNCPSGQVCMAASYSTVGGCYPESVVPVDPKKLGAECSASTECESGLCYSDPGQVQLCRQKCDVANPSCFASYQCKDIGGQGACIPGDGLKDDGAECASGDECKNQACVALPSAGLSYCRTTCDLATWVCQSGTSCVSYGSSQVGACMSSVDRKAAGEACASNEECVSMLCRDDGNSGRFCTQNCVDGWCPNDMVCITGDAWGDVCAPAGSIQPPLPDGEGSSEEDTSTINPQNSPGSGCATLASLPGSSRLGTSAIPALMLLLLLGGLATRRSTSIASRRSNACPVAPDQGSSTGSMCR